MWFPDEKTSMGSFESSSKSSTVSPNPPAAFSTLTIVKSTFFRSMSEFRARSSARRESIEAYLERLHRLEEIAMSKQGVDRVYAMQAGRDVRVMVLLDQVDDIAAQLLARDIAKQFEEELSYPGQIKVTVIRESRATEVAR